MLVGGARATLGASHASLETWETHSVKPILSILRTYASYWRHVVGAGLFAMFGAVAESAALVIVAATAPELGSAEAAVSVSLGPLAFNGSTLRMLGIAGTLIAGATASRVLSSFIGARATAGWTAGRRRDALFAYLRASYSYIARQPAARIQEITGQHARLAGTVVSLLSTTLNAVLSLVVFMVSALVLNAPATLVFFLLGTVSIVALRPMFRWTRAQSSVIAGEQIALGLNVSETTGVVREVKTLGVVDEFEGRFDRTVTRLATVSERVNFALNAVPQVFIGLGMLVLLGTFAVAATVSAGSFATLGGTALLLFRAMTYGQQVSRIQQQLGRALPYTEGLNTFIVEAEAAAAAHSGGDVRLSSIDTVRFENTEFRYDDDLAPAIKDVTFEISRPALVALVGPSGAGKTTIAHLALGLLRPSQGNVSLDGISMSEIYGGDLAGMVALVPQEPVVIHATVMDNIRFFRDHVSEEAVVETAKAIGIHETIMALEDGYATEIGQTTRGLSGGQRQRIAIARALVGEPSLIILDEPTSALDAESERWVMDALDEVSSDAIALVIAHRQETIDRCDTVLRFGDGQVQDADLTV